MIEFNPSRFRLLFPEFADEEKFTDALLEMHFELAPEYIDLIKPTLWPLELMTAHLLHLRSRIVSGNGAQFGTMSSASEGSVSVSFAAPQTKTAMQAWLAGSPYGQQLWSWLHIKSAGGWSVGGRPERDAFRKYGGAFL